MGYGVDVECRCPACGRSVTVMDYDRDPPPIPMRVRPQPIDDDGRPVMFCPGCDEELDGEAMLAAAKPKEER